MITPRLLIFTNWFYPGFKAGGPIRSVVNLVNAIDTNLDIYIFTSDRDFEDKEAYHEITAQQWVSYGQNSRVFYASPDFLSYKNIKKIINDLKPDTIYLNSMWSVNFTLIPLMILKLRTQNKIVFAPRGMLKPSALASKSIKKKLFLWFFKNFIFWPEVIFHATDIEEKKSIEHHFSNPINVLGNLSTNTAYVSPIAKNSGSLNLVYISRIHPIKNLAFIIELFTHYKFNGSITLSVYGPEEDKNYIIRCKKLSKYISDNIFVEFIGPAYHSETNKIIGNNHFFILPTLGENFGHAIFESFAAGRPVIISDQTPWRDLEYKMVGFDLPLDNSEVWVQTIQKCADMNQSEFDKWCANAHKYAENYSDNSYLKEQYIKLFS